MSQRAHMAATATSRPHHDPAKSIDQITTPTPPTHPLPPGRFTEPNPRMRRATTLALGAALVGLLLLAPAAVEAKGLRMTLEATGEQLLHAAQEAAGIDTEADDVVRA